MKKPTVTIVQPSAADLYAGNTITISCKTNDPDNPSPSLWLSTDNRDMVEINGTTVQFKKAGTCTITAHMPVSGGEVTDTITITVAEDKPNIMLGNVNGDTLVDTRDAAAILRHATLVSSNMPGIFTGDQFIAADVDGNGIVDTKDAQMVLAYSTWASSVTDNQTVMSLEEWIESE